MKFAELLAAKRTARRMSQSRLGEAAGFDHSYISRLEGGSRVPTREAVDRLIGALELRAHEADELRMSAGFMPTDERNLFADEPYLADAAWLLKHGASEPVRSHVRQGLASLVELAMGLR